MWQLCISYGHETDTPHLECVLCFLCRQKAHKVLWDDVVPANCRLISRRQCSQASCKILTAGPWSDAMRNELCASSSRAW